MKIILFQINYRWTYGVGVEEAAGKARFVGFIEYVLGYCPHNRFGKVSEKSLFWVSCRTVWIGCAVFFSHVVNVRDAIDGR